MPEIYRTYKYIYALTLNITFTKNEKLAKDLSNILDVIRMDTFPKKAYKWPTDI